MKTKITRTPLQRTKAPGTKTLENYEDIKRKARERKKKQARKPFNWLNRNERTLRAELCRRDFAYFIKYFWDTVAYDDLKWNWHIDVYASELQYLAERVAQGLPKKYDLIINVPPGSTKSKCCSVMFPVWCWINWYWMRFIAASYSSPLSLEQAEYSRDIVRSNKFQWLFPELVIRKDKKAKSNFQLIKRTGRKSTAPGGNRFSTSVGGTLTGFHGHILIVDDPLDPNRALHDTEIDRANHWISQTLSMRKIEKRVVPTIMIMQRLHQNDPTGHMLEKKNDSIRLICLPGEIDNYYEQVNPPELKSYYKNNLLDPERMPREVLRDMEQDLGQHGYAGQIGQFPVPPGGGMFKVDMFVPTDSMPNKNQIVRTVRYWDKAGTDAKKNKRAAYTVGVKMHKLRNGKFLISDVKRGQWSTEKRENIIRKTAEADGKQVEVGIEEEGGSGGPESADSTIKNLAGFKCFKDKATKSEGDKVTRADTYSVQVNNGNVLLLNGDWNSDFVEEHRFFPYGTFKDQIDASSGAFRSLAGKKQVRILDY